MQILEHFQQENQQKVEQQLQLRLQTKYSWMYNHNKTVISIEKKKENQSNGHIYLTWDPLEDDLREAEAWNSENGHTK